MAYPSAVTEPDHAPWRTARRERYRLRGSIALAVSIGLHALIATLELGDPGFGLPGLTLPWAERRVQPPLVVRLVEAPRPPAPVQPVAVVPEPPKPAVPPRADKSFEVVAPAPPRKPEPKPMARPLRESGEPAPAAEVRARKPVIEARPQPELLALDEPGPETFNVPPPAAPETEPARAPEIVARTQIEALPAAQETDEEARRKEVAARQQAEADEASRLAAEAQAEARRKEEEARQLALVEARRKEEEARRLAVEAEAEATRKAEVEKRKEEEARRLAVEAEAEATRRAEVERRKEEEARRLAAEAEAEATRRAEVERRKEAQARRLAQEAAERKRAEAQAAAERERVAVEQARAAAAAASAAAGASPAPGALSGRELAAKVLGQLRTPGAIPLDPPRPPPPPADRSRRRAILGVERDVVLRMYAESWRTKIERNGPLNYRPSAGMRAPEDPLVTVAIRSDGSVEHVHIHRSSGLRELDEAVRRIVEFYAPYSRFPPAVASQYDVIEIRRVWQFDGALRLVEETK